MMVFSVADVVGVRHASLKIYLRFDCWLYSVVVREDREIRFAKEKLTKLNVQERTIRSR